MVESAFGKGRASQDHMMPETAAMLHPVADELFAIACRLRDAASGTNQSNPDESISRSGAASHASGHLDLARKAYAMRRKRDSIFGNANLFGEPAWDILLDLFIAHADGKAVSVTSACIGSAAPATTGLRWLGILADEGLVVRENDPEDNRRVIVRLTPTSIAGMSRFFDEAEFVA